MRSEQVLLNLIKVILTNLEELNSCEIKNEFVYGEKTAYVECLEIIMLWGKSPIKQSNVELEKTYLQINSKT